MRWNTLFRSLTICQEQNLRGCSMFVKDSHRGGVAFGLLASINKPSANYCNACDEQRLSNHLNSLLKKTQLNFEELKLSAQLNSLTLKQMNHTPVLAPSYNKNDAYHIGYIPTPFSKVIVDPAVKSAIINDPSLPSRAPDVIDDPAKTTSTPPSYEARHIQQIRKWHMNRHKLKKMRKKNLTMILRVAFLRKRRKKMVIEDELDCIRKDGEQFNALEFVKERLASAKAGGYVQDITKSVEDQPPVPWDEYSVPKRKVKTYERKVFPTLKKRPRTVEKQKARNKK